MPITYFMCEILLLKAEADCGCCFWAIVWHISAQGINHDATSHWHIRDKQVHIVAISGIIPSHSLNSIVKASDLVNRV